MILRIGNTNDIIAVLQNYKNDIELMFANGYKRRCYLVLAGFMVDYKEQVFIIDIKVNMQYLICNIPLKERELVIRLWEP